MTIINRKKKQFLTHWIFGLLAVSIYTSCIDKFEKLEKYQRPDWLQGKIYTQISSQENMSIFSQFMVDIGYDKVVDKTGTYAAFVPSDSVMKIYLLEKYGTFEPSEIDSSIKSDIVKYHILLMPWSKTQLQSLSSFGWIDLSDISNNKPTAFKRKTLLREPNRTYNVRSFLSADPPYEIILPDNVLSSTKRTVYNNTPKYAPLFFDGFMNARGLNSDDYSFYFNRPYEYGEVFFVNAKIVGEEIFAENGFIYTLDQVVEPLKNAEQILEDGPYSKFLQLIHNNSIFKENIPATLAQEGASEGAEVTKLYDLTYSGTGLTIDIHSELVGTSTNTLQSNEGLLAPNDEAMDEFFDQYLKNWGNSWSSVPEFIQDIFVKAHMGFEAIYKKDLSTGFYNANGDIIDSNDIDIETVSYGSNSTFIGLNKAVVPRSFSSVSAPLFLNPSYNSFLYAFNHVDLKLISILKDPNTEFSFFIIDNGSLARDSSLFITQSESGRIFLTALDQGEKLFVNLLGSSYKGLFKRRLFGQIGIQPIIGQAKREFIETLDGRHMVVQNDTISGGAPSQFGFNRTDKDTTVVFSEIEGFTATNGRMYKCDGWLNYPTKNTYRQLEGSKFLTLLNSVGLASALNERLTFMDPTERYTIFLPSNDALNSIQVDTLSLEEKRKLVSFHIVKGDLIFTDGRQPQGAYRTLDNKFIHLNPQPDNLIILDENYDVYYDKLVLSPRVNLVGMNLQILSESYYITNAVVHQIDTVITPY